MATALYPVPPTVARFRAACPTPLRDGFEDIPDADIEVALEQHAAELESALGDRATLPITEWDASCDGHVRALAARTLMAHRGYKKSQGADNEIADIAKRADEFLARCRPGGALGKSENPRFTDSATNAVIDAPRVISSSTSDAWTRRGKCATSRRCGSC